MAAIPVAAVALAVVAVVGAVVVSVIVVVAEALEALEVEADEVVAVETLEDEVVVGVLLAAGVAAPPTVAALVISLAPRSPSEVTMSTETCLVPLRRLELVG
jgi:repressor of nif and glnA expression